MILHFLIKINSKIRFLHQQDTYINNPLRILLYNLLYNLRILLYNLRILLYNLRILLYNPRILLYNLRILLYNPRILLYNLRILLYNLYLRRDLRNHGLPTILANEQLETETGDQIIFFALCVWFIHMF